MLTFKLRYKETVSSKSQLIEHRLKESDLRKTNMSGNFMLAAAIAEFGMLLRDSQHKASATYQQTSALLAQVKLPNAHEDIAELQQLIQTADLLYRYKPCVKE